MSNIIYYSNVTGMTHKLVTRLDMDTLRLPLNAAEASQIRATEPFVLITPTYGGGKDTKNFVPQVVKKFLSSPHNSFLLQGVIASGSLNFREEFARAGDIISRRFDVPYLYRFDLAGNTTDVIRIQEGLTSFWNEKSLNNSSRELLSA